MTDAEIREKVLREQARKLILNQAASQANPPKQRVRAIAQGVTLGGADEIEAFIRSFRNSEDYSTALSDVRGKLKQYKEDYPKSSLAYEMGGATVPALLAAPFTGGASVPATMGRMAMIGGGEAAAYGFNTGEGGVKNRVVNAAINAPLGAIASPLGAKATSLVTDRAIKYFDSVRRKFGNKASSAVQAEINRLVNENGMTFDEAVKQVEGGRILADLMPEDTRAAYAQGGEAGDIIKKAVNEREKTLTSDSLNTLQTDLVPQSELAKSGGNVVKAMNTRTDDLVAEENKVYNKIWASNEAKTVSQSITNQIQEIANLDKRIVDEIAQDISAAKLPKLFDFKKGKDGKVIFNFLRNPDLKSAEIIRRSLDDLAFNSAKNRRESYRALERALRTEIDNFSPATKNARAKWSNIMTAHETFKIGRSALGKTADDVEILFDKAVQGSPEQVAAFRAGVAASFKNKTSTGQRSGLIFNLNDLTRKERQILETIYPSDSLDDALKKINLAAQAQFSAKNLKGSQTAITTARVGNRGKLGTLNDMRQLLTQGDMGAMVRLISQIGGKATEKLSDNEKTYIARLLIDERPDALTNLLTDTGGMAKLQGRIMQLANLAKRATASGTTVGVSSTANSLLQ